MPADLTPGENWALYSRDRPAWIAERLPVIMGYMLSSIAAANHCWDVMPTDMKEIAWRAMTKEQRQFIQRAREELCASRY